MDQKEGKRALTLDDLKKIVAASGPQTDQKLDDHAIAALAATSTDGDWVPEKTKSSIDKAPPLVEKKLPLAEPWATEPAKPASSSAPPVMSLDAREKLVLAKTDDYVARSNNGVFELVTSAEVSKYGSKGVNTKDGTVNPTLGAGLQANATISGTINVTDRLLLNTTVQYGASGGLSIDLHRGEVSAGGGLDVAVEGSASYDVKLADDKSIVLTGVFKASASAEANVKISAKDGVVFKGEAGATLGAGVGVTYTKGNEAIGGHVGVEVGVGAKVAGNVTFSDGKWGIALDIKLAVGVGAKIKINVAGETEGHRAMQMIKADLAKPDSALNKALAKATTQGEAAKALYGAYFDGVRLQAAGRGDLLDMAKAAGMAKGVQTFVDVSAKHGKAAGYAAGLGAAAVGTASQLVTDAGKIGQHVFKSIARLF